MSVMHARHRAIAGSAAMSIVAFNSCADPVTDQSALRSPATASRDAAVPLGDATASVRWSAITRAFIAAKPAATKPNPVAAFRAFAYLSLAQYRAVLSAVDVPGIPPHASPQAAVASASAVVLSALFPADAEFFASQLRSQMREAGESTKAQEAFTAGETIGRAIGAEVAELARDDRFDAVWTGTVPIREDYWTSDFNPPRPPQLPLLGQMRPFFMESGNQLRPPPPPAFGSPEFLAALQEVRRISDTRTPEQLRIAEYWAMTTGSLTSGFWNEEATKRIAGYRLNERRAARTMALVSMAAMDATIACYDAKYTYWLIRPYKADAGITVPITKPNHPSYPSSHSCSSAAAAHVLAAIFPADAAELLAMADHAGESRIYAGIHYRFDIDAGQTIGQKAAALALSRGALY
jgi:hypothetical protein